MKTEMKYLWWQKGIIYQIYPRSYQDSNSDGIGDLPGIMHRLDYIQSLGVDAVWLSPIFPSPMHDFGYDVADYCAVNKMFGTLTDLDNLLAAVHARGMKLLLDLVPNHTSDEHVWFQESRSSRDNPKRDWYIWRDPAPDGEPPNNWLSYFGGPAWTFDELTGQYYLHQFVTQQPELNYRHPDVLPAMLDVMRFWLDRGIDGFRVDVIWLMLKDPDFRDEPLDPDWDGVNPRGSLQHIYTQDVEGIHEIVQQMRAVLDAYDERMMVGEIYLPNEKLMTYYGANLDECHLPFNFQLIKAPWDAQTVRQLVNEYEADLPPGGWPNWVLGNHDQPRLASRVGKAQARVANMFLLTLRGTPTTYYGEEIGMQNVPIPPEFVQDPPAVNLPEIADEVGRDPERTPMQWDGSLNAGFAEEGIVPWLPIAANYKTHNVAQQEADPTSILNLYRTLTKLRRSEPALHVGDYEAVDTATSASRVLSPSASSGRGLPKGSVQAVADIFAYQRIYPGADTFLIVLNFGAETRQLNLSQVAAKAVIAVASDMQRSGEVDLGQLIMNPNEGLVLRVATANTSNHSVQVEEGTN